jgi:hypothetical protein
LPSPRSAVCIIAMSVEPREIGAAARSACPHPIAPNSFLSKDRSKPELWPSHVRSHRMQTWSGTAVRWSSSRSGAVGMVVPKAAMPCGSRGGHFLAVGHRPCLDSLVRERFGNRVENALLFRATARNQ